MQARTRPFARPRRSKRSGYCLTLLWSAEPDVNAVACGDWRVSDSALDCDVKPEVRRDATAAPALTCSGLRCM